jgi:hypothetical protein
MKYRRGDVREDGYVFQRYKKLPNGKTYPVFRSQLSLKKDAEASRKWRIENPEKVRAAVSAWKAKNKDRVREHNRRYAKAKREAQAA